MTILVLVRLGVTPDCGIQMLVVCVLVRGCRGMREASDVTLWVRAIPDSWTLHTTMRVVRMEAVRIALVRRASLHFKQRIHYTNIKA